MPKRKPPVVIEVTRNEAYAIIKAFRESTGKQNKASDAAFDKVGDAICQWDEVNR